MSFRGRPVCVWVLSHLEAPIVEWDSYFATMFAPLVPRVIYGMTAGQEKNQHDPHCVMNAWKVIAFYPPSNSGGLEADPWGVYVLAAHSRGQ